MYAFGSAASLTILVLSPKIAPPVLMDEGSTACEGKCRNELETTSHIHNIDKNIYVHYTMHAAKADLLIKIYSVPNRVCVCVYVCV